LIDEKFLTTEESNSHKFNCIEIKWKKNDLIIDFSKEGYVTETFILLKCFLNNNKIKINSIFLVHKEDQILKKERIDYKMLINMSYINFVSWINEKNAIILPGSGEFKNWKSSGIEIRMDSKEKYYPSEIGCEILINNIKFSTF